MPSSAKRVAAGPSASARPKRIASASGLPNRSCGTCSSGSSRSLASNARSSASSIAQARLDCPRIRGVAPPIACRGSSVAVRAAVMIAIPFLGPLFEAHVSRDSPYISTIRTAPRSNHCAAVPVTLIQAPPRPPPPMGATLSVFCFSPRLVYSTATHCGLRSARRVADQKRLKMRLYADVRSCRTVNTARMRARSLGGATPGSLRLRHGGLTRRASCGA